MGLADDGDAGARRWGIGKRKLRKRQERRRRDVGADKTRDGVKGKSRDGLFLAKGPQVFSRRRGCAIGPSADFSVLPPSAFGGGE